MSDDAAHSRFDAGWRVPPAQPALHPDEVHVWRVQLDAGQEALVRWRAALAPDELERASRFHFARDRDRYIAAHGALRTILGGYLGAAPEEVQFEYNAHGKPRLKQPTAGDRTLFFNISHSRALALYAVTCSREVGIDVEFVRPDLAEGRIAERFFAAGEVASLRGLPVSEQPLAFFQCWTRKEAFVKARGEGLSLPLDRFEVSLGPGQPAALLHVADAPGEASRWTLCALDPAPDYIAALAVEGQGWRLSTWDFVAARDGHGGSVQ